jgi:hypothetical protein
VVPKGRECSVEKSDGEEEFHARLKKMLRSHALANVRLVVR